MARHMKGRRARPDPRANLYVFKVALAGQKSIWRRIAIPSDQTLDDLHEAIFRAFDRFDEHLYSFYLPPPGARGRAALRDAVEYTSPIMIEEAELLGGPQVHNAGITAIGSLGLMTGRTLKYLFDFGDEWWHDVTVEQTDGEPGPGTPPKCSRSMALRHPSILSWKKTTGTKSNGKPPD